MKKISILQLLTLILVLATSCSKSNMNDLKREIANINSRCPIDMGMMGKMTNVAFDSDNNTIDYTFHISDDLAPEFNLERLDNPDFKLILIQQLLSKNKNVEKGMLDNNIGFRYLFKNSTGSETIGQMVISADDIRKAAATPYDPATNNRYLYETMIDECRRQIGSQIDEGLYFTDLYDEDDCLSFVYTFDPDIYDTDVLKANAATPGIVEAMKSDIINAMDNDAIMINLVNVLSKTDKGLEYIYAIDPEDPDTPAVTVTFTPAEVKDLANSMQLRL